MELLKIKINPNFHKDNIAWEKKKKRTVLILIGIGIFNILVEFFIRKFLDLQLANSLVEIFHIFVYFVIPLIFSSKRLYIIDYFLLTIFFLIGSILYTSMEYGIISSFFNIIFLPLLVIIIFYFKERKINEKLLILFRSWKKIFFYFALSAILIGGHLFFVVSISQNYSFQIINFYSNFPKLFYMAFSVFGAEIFFRGFIFNKINRELKIPFWISASISTILFIGPFFANPFFTSNSKLLTSIVFYLLILGFVFCALTKKTKSIIPSYLLNLLMGILRYLIILGTI